MLNGIEFQTVGAAYLLLALILCFFHGIRQIFTPIISQWLKIDL